MKLVILDRDGTINYDSDVYVKAPEERTTLVLVATDVDRQRKIFKALVESPMGLLA